MKCLRCKKETINPKFCSRSCAATYNNIGIRRHGKSHWHNCPICKTKINLINKYCSDVCWRKSFTNKYEKYIIDWKTGKKLGLTTNGVVTEPVKKYLRIKFKNKCCLCGWNKLNPFTNKVPLIADHIDGNWKNNIEENLRLICSNCDTLSKTYGGSNRGNGRKDIKKSWGRKLSMG